MPIPLSILDQSPVVTGATPREAVLATLELARAADAQGYARYWLAEHHAMRGLADPAPEILLARIAAETARIRVGSGGVLLPHYAALKVAEQFRMLETLSPGRIDLGIGRAPGGTPLVSHALASHDVAHFPRQVCDLLDFLDDTIPIGHPFAELAAMPTGPSAPELWLLGSSDYSAALAAELGLPFCLAIFLSGEAPAVTRSYRRAFRPSARAAEPRVMLTVAAMAAETTEQADELATTTDLWRMRIRRGIDLPIPTVAEAQTYPYSCAEADEVAYHRRRVAVGTASEVRAQVEALAQTHHADEVMLLTIGPDYASRARSYALLAPNLTLAPQEELLPAR